MEQTDSGTRLDRTFVNEIKKKFTTDPTFLMLEFSRGKMAWKCQINSSKRNNFIWSKCDSLNLHIQHGFQQLFDAPNRKNLKRNAKLMNIARTLFVQAPWHIHKPIYIQKWRVGFDFMVNFFLKKTHFDFVVDIRRCDEIDWIIPSSFFVGIKLIEHVSNQINNTQTHTQRERHTPYGKLNRVLCAAVQGNFM